VSVYACVSQKEMNDESSFISTTIIIIDDNSFEPSKNKKNTYFIYRAFQKHKIKIK
jgi:hypothetical protein